MIHILSLDEFNILWNQWISLTRLSTVIATLHCTGFIISHYPMQFSKADSLISNFILKSGSTLLTHWKLVLVGCEDLPHETWFVCVIGHARLLLSVDRLDQWSGGDEHLVETSLLSFVESSCTPTTVGWQVHGVKLSLNGHLYGWIQTKITRTIQHVVPCLIESTGESNNQS